METMAVAGRRAGRGAVLIALLVLASGTRASAQASTDFYKGRNLELYVGYSVGGG